MERTQSILEFLDALRKNVEEAVDITGKFTVERPSIRPAYGYPCPPTWEGANHLRYTIKLDVLLPREGEERKLQDFKDRMEKIKDKAKKMHERVQNMELKFLGTKTIDELRREGEELERRLRQMLLDCFK